ncbi:adenine nucleotide translocase lysine N-methyltransferase isoform X3 [Anolis carolinensis]|uniref:adenine nucleotide translocase lysine N-methyltransferase isoform X3 n=1 Tax=Anolis carolinensis TaxID=28377 RepID=UPI002F2B3BC7
MLGALVSTPSILRDGPIALRFQADRTSAGDMNPEDAGEAAAELQGKTVDGWGLLQIAAGTGLTAYVVWAGILMPGFRKVPLKLQVPYVPASIKQVENVMSLLKGRSGKMVDLGSGDGRIVLEAYKQGFRPAIGYELNPWLLRRSGYHAWKAGCYGKVSFLREDLWKVDLSDCKNVTVFLAPSVLLLLERKLLLELPEDARVITGRFPLPNWIPTATAGEGVNQAWAYDIKSIRGIQQDKSEGSPV